MLDFKSSYKQRLHNCGKSTLFVQRLQKLIQVIYRTLNGLYPAYYVTIDFDSLDRNSLWNILKTIGIPPKLVDIIKTLYSSTHSVVRLNGTISEAFSISSGARQGCVRAANLFNTATDRILNNNTQAMTLGVNCDDSGQHITDLDYADDIVIFADLLNTLKDAVYIYLTNNPTNWGYMSTGPRPSFSPSTHGYPLLHQHSSEHNLSQRPTSSHTLAAPSPVITSVLATSTAA